MTLTEFLLARIAEDEAVARAAAHSEATSAWVVGYDSERVTDPGGVQVVPYAPEPISHHIARHDPARVLAECEAKRRIVEAAQRTQVSLESRRAPATDAINGHVIAYRDVVRQLASVYADHPDYRPEWRA